MDVCDHLSIQYSRLLDQFDCPVFWQAIRLSAKTDATHVDLRGNRQASRGGSSAPLPATPWCPFSCLDSDIENFIGLFEYSSM